MLKEKCEASYLQLTKILDEIAKQEASALEKMTGSVKAIRNTLGEMRVFVATHPFTDEKEEILFFKMVKPRCYSLLIFQVAQFNTEFNRPVATREELCNYYLQELEVISRFFRQYAFVYTYFRNEMTELDHLYFIRAESLKTPLLPDVLEPDPEFSTSWDYLFSKIKAYELLQEYLLKQLQKLNPTDIGLFADNSETDLPELKWTGDKVNLVEVIYALYFTGQINNGNADISLLIRFMEKHLQIDLSRAYRDFIDIRNRKVSSPTRYIDQMRESIHKRVDDDLAFKQHKRSGARFSNS